MLARIGVDGLVRPAVDGEVGLCVAVDVQTAHGQLRRDRALEDARQDLPSLPFDLARHSDIDRHPHAWDTPLAKYSSPKPRIARLVHWSAFRRLRWAACFALFPQIAMLHHRRARAARAIHEQKRTGRTLAGLHILKIFAADEFGDFLADRQEQRFRGTPSPQRLQPQSGSPSLGLGHDLIESFVAVEQVVQRLQFTQVVGPEPPDRSAP